MNSSKYNINRLLIILGFIMLLLGFFITENSTIEFQFPDINKIISKPQLIRAIGILSVLNGLLYFLFENKNLRYNIRIKTFGLVLYFLSMLILFLSNFMLFLKKGESIVKDGATVVAPFQDFSSAFIVAGLFTLFLSLLTPVVIWLAAVFNKRD